MKKLLVAIVFLSASAAFAQTAPAPYQFPDAEKRFKRFVMATVGPGALTGAVMGATFGTIANEPPEWQKNGRGFGKRFASNMGQGAIRQTTQYGLSELLRQDQAYRKCECSGFGKRFGYAVKSGFTARNRSGKQVFSIPKVVSPFVGSVAAVKLWQPDRLTVRDGMRRGAVGFAFGVGFNVVREFLFRK